MKIGIVRERQEHERRVAASPDAIKRYKSAGQDVIVERGAGVSSAIPDSDFEAAGATLVDGAETVFYEADILLKVRRPTEDETSKLRSGQVLIGALEPFADRKTVDAYANRGVSAFSLELLPRTTRAQAMDILSSQANLAGYKAVIDSASAYAKVMPMMMTAAGTVTPAKIFIVGAGVAGLQAIATARRLGAVVSATDVRPAAREEVQSLGAKFVGYVPDDAAASGGYARALTKEEQQKQAEMVADHIKTQDIVVTTAQIPGRQAPRIVSKEMVESMRPGAVLFDLAAESGGNIEGSTPGQTTETDNGVRIIGARNIASGLAPATSLLYAKNIMNFVNLLIDQESKELRIDLEDDLIKGALLTKDGKVIHPSFAAAPQEEA
ncbi:MAG: Re/Si-specific NAD(P)(+) transhydrogenase subunit alpha [Pseudomonadota bacterium]